MEAERLAPPYPLDSKAIRSRRFSRRGYEERNMSPRSSLSCELHTLLC